MKSRLPSGMAEATRLTGAGRLAEATALIQGLLRGHAPGAPVRRGRDPEPDVIDVEAVTLDGDEPAPASHGPRHGPFPTDRPRRRLGETLSDLLARSLKDAQFRPAKVPPAPVPDGATFETFSFAAAAGARTYKLYVPANRSSAEGGRGPALVVMLHGCTQSPDDFAVGTRMNAVAEEFGCLVAYPEQPASANPNLCWNWFTPQDQQRDGGEPSIMAGITQRIVAGHGIDPARVYVAGLSAGGAAAAVLAEAYPDLYAAAGVHSGLPAGCAHDIPSAFAAMRQGGQSAGARPGCTIPVIVFHGDRDAMVHPLNGDRVAARAHRGVAGARAVSDEGQAPGGHAYRRTVHADAAGRVLCEHWTILGAGHAWAGGSPDGSHTDPRGPDASREMLRFFLENPRRG